MLVLVWQSTTSREEAKRVREKSEKLFSPLIHDCGAREHSSVVVET